MHPLSLLLGAIAGALVMTKADQLLTEEPTAPKKRKVKKKAKPLAKTVPIDDNPPVTSIEPKPNEPKSDSDHDSPDSVDDDID